MWDKATGVYSDVQYFHPSQVSKIIESYLEPAGGGGFLYTLSKREKGNDLMEIYHVGEINDVESNFMKERIHNPYKKFIVPESGRSEIPDKISNAVLFFGMRPNGVAEKIIRNLEGIGGINPMHYHDWYGDEITEVEAFPDGATKAKAIKRLKEKTGARKVVVFGDNMNDLSMMKAADWSVAVANAVPAVKEAADEVIGSNCADSVPRYILASLNNS